MYCIFEAIWLVFDILTHQAHKMQGFEDFNPIALRKAKIVCNFGLSECSRVIVVSSYEFIKHAFT